MKTYRIDVYDLVLKDYVGPGQDPYVDRFGDAREIVEQLRTIWRDDSPAYFRIVELDGEDETTVWADDLPNTEDEMKDRYEVVVVETALNDTVTSFGRDGVADAHLTMQLMAERFPAPAYTMYIYDKKHDEIIADPWTYDKE